MGIWEGYLTVDTSGYYVFSMSVDDGARVYLGGQLIIDDWVYAGVRLSSTDQYLDSLAYYPVRVEYYQWTLGARIILN